MRRDIEVKVIVEPRIDSSAVLPPASLALEVEYVVFKHGIQRGAIFTEHFDLIVLTHVVGVIVDVNMLCRPLAFKPVEINAFPIVLADVVAYKHVACGPFHDAAEPEIVVTVVVLNISMGTVIVCIEGAPVLSTFSYVSVNLVILDLDATGVEAEYAVARAVAAAVRQGIVLIHSILADTRYNAVSARMVNEIARHIDVGPEMAQALPL
jgi:hypothetical protein